MKDRRLTFDERRQQLVSALSIMRNALADYEAMAQIAPLRNVAVQLRALILYKPGSHNFRHPLLVDLARERNFPLTVYRTDPAYATKVKQLGPIYYSEGDNIGVDKDELRQSETTLDVVLAAIHVMVLGEECTLEQVFRFVADKEAGHYDPDRPRMLDDFDRVSIGGLPEHYRVVYHLGRVVCDLTTRFLQATI